MTEHTNTDAPDAASLVATQFQADLCDSLANSEQAYGAAMDLCGVGAPPTRVVSRFDAPSHVQELEDLSETTRLGRIANQVNQLSRNAVAFPSFLERMETVVSADSAVATAPTPAPRMKPARQLTLAEALGESVQSSAPAASALLQPTTIVAVCAAMLHIYSLRSMRGTQAGGNQPTLSVCQKCLSVVALKQGAQGWQIPVGPHAKSGKGPSKCHKGLLRHPCLTAIMEASKDKKLPEAREILARTLLRCDRCGICHVHEITTATVVDPGVVNLTCKYDSVISLPLTPTHATVTVGVTTKPQFDYLQDMPPVPPEWATALVPVLYRVSNVWTRYARMFTS